MKEQVIFDHFGRRTVFTGEHLVCETTDSADQGKPQWLEVDVWRTQSGNFVVKRSTKYRIRHSDETCYKADGFDLIPATEDDTYSCGNCGDSHGPGYAQSPRTTVDVYKTPQELILGFQNEGRFNNLARAVLAEICEQDDRVDAAWNTVVVP